MISQEAIQEFKKVWKAEFDEDISDEEATKDAVSLLALFDAIYKPIKKDWLKKFDETKKGK